ncbi:unnamed protein product [Didymodactylos carnosus]|uniref:RRM domain-containing protein n=1 Tax=Didymodactylos carnosus TaxID=1234261 RepID=A0A816C144_9BILA|nr:unnamed protein product [Didymodactylos carnosus]CAF1616810.1 unnamed protein product [Didymodactylos carnosus]CAF3696091.1 unnamed protein product [Didymodactylos carnosus]CAF4504104.1 unnamed protein product [Didymodactylos carnosus]
MKRRRESDCRNSRERVLVNVCQPVKQDVYENSANLLRRVKKKRKINYNLFISELPWNCTVPRIVKAFKERGYSKIRVKLAKDDKGRFTGMAFVEFSKYHLTQLIEEHSIKPFCISKNRPLHMKRLLHNVPYDDKLTRCAVSSQIKIIFAPLFDTLPDHIIRTAFERYGRISHLTSYYDEELCRLVCDIQYKNYDSVDQVIQCSPFDPLCIESVHKAIDMLPEYHPQMIQHRKKIDNVKVKRAMYHEKLKGK